ncbi:MAG: sugar ABC transporter permease [Anaerolineales bacterium]
MSVKSAVNTFRRSESARSGLLFVIPALVLVLLFLVLPILYTIRLSVAKGPGFQMTGFIGLQNYDRLFSDRAFLATAKYPPTGALINSLQWMVFAVPAVTLIGLIVALVADHSRFQTFIRGAFFLPMVISGTVIGIIWTFVFAPTPSVGLLNAITGGAQSWLGDPKVVNYSLMAAWIWGSTGYSVVIIAAALKGISIEIVDAARVDGAHGWSLFWHITLPSIRVPMSFLLVTQLVEVLKVFDVVFVMTRGGPAGLSRTLALLFYEQSFVYFNPQYGAAIVVIMSVVIVVVFSITRRISEGGANA